MDYNINVFICLRLGGGPYGNTFLLLLTDFFAYNQKGVFQIYTTVLYLVVNYYTKLFNVNGDVYIVILLRYIP